MNFSQRKLILLTVAGLVTFAFVAALMLQFLPGPRKDSDYLVAGAVATAAALGVVFAAILSDPQAREIFFRGKGKQ
ncbi:hypothetical protein F183_A23540 [Bryobacterales bacterium F-183]|nr:hypothetical protein F183_A23540 [Bryobacterales bacterium F-183]